MSLSGQYFCIFCLIKHLPGKLKMAHFADWGEVGTSTRFLITPKRSTWAFKKSTAQLFGLAGRI